MLRRLAYGPLIGALGAFCALGACALDESGTSSDGGGGPDVIKPPVEGGGQDADGGQDVTYDVPDLGVGETEAGLPCTCVTSVPSGYTVVEYVPNQRPGCSNGYGSSTDYVENPTSAQATCGCTCSATPTQAPTCSCGANPATFNMASGNGNCTDITGQTVVASTTCYKTAQTYFPNGQKLNDFLAAPATACTPSGGQCGNPNKTTNIPNPSAEQGRACNLTAAMGTCTSGTCIPNQASPFGLCVTNGSVVGSCPADFPVPHTVGTSISDTRTCSGTCGCSLTNLGTCGTPQLTLYSGDTNCGNSGTNVTTPADGTTCTFAGYGNGTTFDSAKYTITQSGGSCSNAGSNWALSGQLGVNGAITICCRP